MQGISLYVAIEGKKDERPFYHTFYWRNGEYLEREEEPDKFRVLEHIDDCDPTHFVRKKHFESLLHDLEIIISEARAKQDCEMVDHLNEIVSMCKIGLWNTGKVLLVISPYEFFSDDQYPQGLPAKYKPGHSNSREAEE